MSTRRRIWKAVLAIAASIMVVVTVFMAWLGWTDAGLSWVLARLGSLDGVQVRVDGVQGHLAGPLQVAAFELDTARVTVRIAGLEADNRLTGLPFGRLAVTRLRADSVDVTVRPGSGAATTSPPAFLPRWLAISFRDVKVGRAGVTLPNGSRLDYQDVSAAGRLTHDRIELRRASLDAGAWSAEGSASLVSRRPLALKADLHWRVPGAQPLAGNLKARGNLDRLALDAGLTAPTTATARILMTDLQASARWQAQLASDSFDLSPWLKQPPVGPLRARLDGRGTFSTYALQGHVDGKGLMPGGADVDARLSRDGGRLVLDAITLRANAQHIQLATSGWLQLTADRALHLESSWSNLRWPLDGAATFTSPQGRGVLDGWSTLDFRIDGSAMALGAPQTRVSATGVLDRDGVTVTRSTFDGAAGHALASGYLGFGPSRPWQLVVTVTGLDLQPFVPGVDSRLSFNAAGSGMGIGPEAAWAAHVADVGGRLRGYQAAGTGTVLHQPGRYAFQGCRLSLGPARLLVDGQLQDRATRLNARLDVPDLSGLLPAAGGRIQVVASLHGASAPKKDRANLRLDVALRGRDLRYDGQHAAVLSADADVDLSDHETSWVRIRAAGVEVAGQALPAARLSLDGLARQHTVDLRLGAGERAVDVTGSGGYRDGNYQLVAERILAAGGGAPPYALEAPLRLAVSTARARLERTCFLDLPRRVCLGGSWDHEQGWSAGLDVTDFPLEALRVDLPRRPGYHGRLDLHLQAAAAPDRPWTATADGTLRDASFSYVTPSGRREQLNLGVTRLRLASLPDRHELRLTTADTQALQLEAEATLLRQPGVSVANSRLTGSAHLATSRLGLLPLLVPDIDRAAGSLRADVTLSGTPAAPVAGGTLDLQDGELDLYPTNLRLRGLMAKVAMHDTRLDILADGKAGDGSFHTQGSLAWTGREPHGQLTLTGERLLVANVPEARVEASPDLRFSIAGRDIAVSGSVTVPTARIEPRQLVGAVPVSPDQVIVGQQADDGAAAGYRVRTDIRLVLGKGVQISAFGLSGTLTGNVLAQTRPGEVATASGELEIHDGKYRAYGKDLTVTRGRLLFAGGPAADPGVDLRAQKQIPGYTIGVTARGRLRKPELGLYSDPSLPQSQVASLLLVGRRLDNLDPADRSTLGSSSNAIAAQGGAILASQLGRYVGLDEVSVERSTSVDASSGAAPDSSLVLGKFLSPRLYVGYGISLTNAINTFKLRYTVGDRWVIAAEAGQQASADIEFTIDR